MKEPVRIGQLIGQVVQKTSDALLFDLIDEDPMITGIHYLYGHYNDIKERLLQKGKTDKPNRYPLICLFEDFRVVNRTLGLFGTVELRLIILHFSRKDVTREQRETNVFEPILVPIYDEFMRQLKLSGFFMQYGPFPHNRIDRPHWGDPGLYGATNKDGGYIFDEILDGIEIDGLQLKTYFNNCEIFAQHV